MSGVSWGSSAHDCNRLRNWIQCALIEVRLKGLILRTIVELSSIGCSDRRSLSLPFYEDRPDLMSFQCWLVQTDSRYCLR